MLVDPEYREWFAPQVFARAEEYQRDGRVRLADHDEERLLFVVAGSKNRFYQVYLEPTLDPGFIEADCSCPYGYSDGYCKHIGAAIIEGLRQGWLRPTGAASGAEFDEKAEAEECTFDLGKIDSTHNASRAAVVEAFRFEATSFGSLGVEHPDARYRLVFVVSELRDWIYRDRPVDTYIVRPALQYIKKNGSPGRVESYADSRERLPVSPRERSLLERVVRAPGNGLPLSEALETFVRAEATVVFRSGRNHRPLLIRPFSKARLSFDLGGFGREMTPLFEPLLNFADAEQTTGWSPVVPASELSTGYSGLGAFFFSSVASMIYYASTERPGTRQLARLVSLSYPVTMPDIRSLSEHADSETIEVKIPTGRVAVRNREPAPRVVVRPVGDGTEVAIDLTYGDRAIDPDAAGAFVAENGVGDELIVWRRDRTKESRKIVAVQRILRMDTEVAGGCVVPLSVPEFLAQFGAALLDQGAEIVMSDGKSITEAKIDIIASSGIDWLDLRVRVGGGQIRSSDIDFDTGLVHLNGSHHVVDRETIDRLRALAANSAVHGDGFRLSRFDLGTIRLVDPLIDRDTADSGVGRIRSAISRLEKGFEQPRLGKPETLEAELRGYQHEGLEWLAFLSEYRFGGILADDMGLGKTVQAIALFAHLVERGIHGPFLVVAPVSTVSNWEREINRFAPMLTVVRHLGSDRSTEARSLAIPEAVVITSYHTLQRDVSLLGEITWSLLVLDESQALKNPRSKSHASVRKLDFDRVIAMSGTPVENNLLDLWSVMSILNPGLLGGRTSFLKRYRMPIDRGDEETIARLRRTIAPFLLRRKKEEVAQDLPPKEESIIDVLLSPAESRYYRSLRGSLREKVLSMLKSDEPFRAATAIIEALTRLRQAAIAPGLVGGPDRSSKIDAIIEKLEEALAEGHRVLVFSQYVRVLKMIETRVTTNEWRYRYIDGSVPEKARKEIIDQFQRGDLVDLLLISLKAGGVGINLTKADYVFLVDPWWNPAVESQAIDRTHRIGQTHPVFSYRFISRGTVEERILDLQESKRELVEHVVGDGRSLFASMSKDEILSLFDDEALP